MPDLLLLKLVATPLLVGSASLAARRWGPSIGGWLVAMPLTSGPVVFFLAVGEGTAFAAEAAVGTLLGLGVLGVWGVGYVAARHRGPWIAVLTAAGVYALFGLGARQLVGLPFPLLAVLSLGVAMLAGRAMPPGGSTRARTAHPAWDLPARVIVGTALVVTLTSVAPLLGATSSGLLSTYPVYVSVLAVFTHLHDGPAGAVDVIRGLLTGLLGTIVFYIVLGPLLVLAGVGPAFVAAILVSGALQVVTLRRVRAHSGS